ncbi:hypothetical protein EC957_004886 [Mortierella hygrophila]|uniref:Uncharacterized protein n=1 Tax=Mortierella hygrophila TaxID=979708 RepID=A0A9P6F1Q1_9FUNG|nr:hypothetical protein EC957_004886 [Mortierella hygrophila]
MVLWSSGISGRGRILSSKRTLISGLLLLLILFYYVALPNPQAGSLDDRTAFQAESAFRKNKKGSALADDTEIMMPLPVREKGPVRTFPWLNSFVERVKLDGRLPVMDYLRGEQEANSVSTADCHQENGASDSCLAPSTSTARSTTEMGMLVGRDPLAAGPYEDALLESKSVEPEVMEDDEGNTIDDTPKATIVENEVATSTNDDWSDEKEAESIQEENDEQGSEKEDGTKKGLLKQPQKVGAISEIEAEAKAHVDEAEEVLEDAMEELREEREEEILDETEEDIMDRVEEAEEEILDRIDEAEEASGEVLTDEMVRMIEDEVVAEEEAGLDENMHRYVETLFRGDKGSEEEEEEEEEEVVAVVEAEVEVEPEYSKEDLLGQAGSGETMDDEE